MKMQNVVRVGGVMVLLAGVCGCSLFVDESQQVRERVATCEDGRSVTYRVARDLSGATKAVSTGEGTFLTFDNNFAQELVEVDADGAVLKSAPSPFAGGESIRGLAPLAGGEAFAVATPPLLQTGSSSVAKLGSDLELVWRRELGFPKLALSMVRAMDDGGVLVAGTKVVFDDQPDAEADVLWARLDRDGETLWSQRLSFERPTNLLPAGWWWGLDSMVLGSDGRVRFFVETTAGLVMISSDLHGGAVEQVPLDTRLALHLAAATALPDGRIAILSDRDGAVVTVVEPSGAVVWERLYGRDHLVEPTGLAYNPVRGELLLSGSSPGTDGRGIRTWLQAVDVDGTARWGFERDAQETYGTEGNVGRVEASTGPATMGLSVGSDGTVIALGRTPELSYFTLGTGACR